MARDGRTMTDMVVDTLIRAFDHVTSVEEVPRGYKDAFHVEIRGDSVVGTLRYVIDDKPVGIWLEYGTRTHWVEPKVKHPLSPEEMFRPRPQSRQTDRIEKRDNPRGVQAPQALSWIQNGKRRFSRGHMVSGIEPRFIMKRTQDRFKQEIRKVIAAEVPAEKPGRRWH